MIFAVVMATIGVMGGAAHADYLDIPNPFTGETYHINLAPEDRRSCLENPFTGDEIFCFRVKYCDTAAAGPRGSAAPRPASCERADSGQ